MKNSVMVIQIRINIIIINHFEDSNFFFFFLLNIYMTISMPALVKFVHGVQVFYSYKRIEERVDYNCCIWISTILACNIRVFFRVLRL